MSPPFKNNQAVAILNETGLYVTTDAFADKITTYATLKEPQKLINRDSKAQYFFVNLLDKSNPNAIVASFLVGSQFRELVCEVNHENGEYSGYSIKPRDVTPRGSESEAEWVIQKSSKVPGSYFIKPRNGDLKGHYLGTYSSSANFGKLCLSQSVDDKHFNHFKFIPVEDRSDKSYDSARYDDLCDGKDNEYPF